MRGFLQYNASFPRFALKRDWDSSSRMSLDDLYKQFGSNCPVTNKLDELFVDWFYTNYVTKLGPDFELVLDEVTSAPRTSNKVVLEASNVEVATSQEDASARLRSLRHTEEVGHIESEIPEMPAARTKLAEIKALQNAPEVVMTGDDLDRNFRKEAEPKRPGTVFALNELAESVTVTPSSKSDRERVNRQLAEVSKGVKILTEEVLTGGNANSVTSQIMVGGSNNTETASLSPKAIDNGESNKRNKYFQGHSNTPTKPEVTIEDIVSAPSKEDAVNMINICKSHSVLKVAKSYLRDVGNQPLVDLIERRLRSLPPFSA